MIPAFEMSCKAMFDQVDSSFQKGMVEHTTTVQQQFESTHSPLALTLRVCPLSFTRLCIRKQFIYIYIYIYMRVCVCVCVYPFFFSFNL